MVDKNRIEDTEYGIWQFNKLSYLPQQDQPRFVVIIQEGTSQYPTMTTVQPLRRSLRLKNKQLKNDRQHHHVAVKKHQVKNASTSSGLGRMKNVRVDKHNKTGSKIMAKNVKIESFNNDTAETNGLDPAPILEVRSNDIKEALDAPNIGEVYVQHVGHVSEDDKTELGNIDGEWVAPAKIKIEEDTEDGMVNYDDLTNWNCHYEYNRSVDESEEEKKIVEANCRSMILGFIPCMQTERSSGWILN